MIRVRMSDGTLLFGLDAENIRRLKDGQPIFIDTTQMGGTSPILLVYGDTQADIIRELESASGQKMPPAQPYFDPSKGRPS